MFRRWILMIRKMSQFGSPREMRKARRVTPRKRLRLEQLEDRLTPSAMSVGSQPDSLPMVSSMVQQEAQLLATVQNEISGIVRAITQEIAQAQDYLLLRLDQILGIAPNLQNLSLISPMPPTANGSGNGNGATTITHIASNQQPSVGTQPAGNVSGSGSGASIKPQDSPGGPDAGGVAGYLWDPTVKTNGVYLASTAVNWDYNMVSQVGNPNAKKPGDTPGDPVTFDPALTNPNTHPGLHNNGGAPITWDYNATFPTMNVGGQSAYDNAQNIDTGKKVELTGAGGTSLTMNQSSSELNLTFQGTAVFQIDGNATITNMYLAGDSTGQFNINGGVTMMAQSAGIVYVENLQVTFNIAKGAEVDDQSYNKINFTGSGSVINVYGTMLVYYDANINPLISNNAGTSGDFINVDGGSLKYAGNGAITNTFTVPVEVQNGGQFYVTSAPNRNLGGALIVQGSVGFPDNASVYLTGASSTIQMSQGATLEADSGYYQDGGTLETTDNSMCNLQIGPNGNLGTATIALGGTVWVDTQANSFGRLNVFGSLDFSGELNVSIQGYVQQNPKIQGTSDVLYVSQTLNLNAEDSSLYVNNYSAQPGDFWIAINSPQEIFGIFGSEISNPEAPLTFQVNYPQTGKYEISD